ncbi:enamine deaminase RidA (YjgF/YER057c/UK114 family) [Rhizomicrobium palustre]|uniref:Enamine deaminase RidA (YjgF/YER057c/UK114 family) n=1 Tax=Rhizomicrobium palustre TaxID=189966 RepID=A0A846N475_9PROT|nr:RidA family protein [Rhizomicrobium palustre]NIK90021.1 enamine deaminase RidA (YjgF/YER057c/UK114 family) [Rhizomicrobium palustre]
MKTFTAAMLAVAAVTAGAVASETPALMSEDPGFRKLQENWGFADARIAGDTIYLSGVVAGTRTGETDLEAAYGRAFEDIGAILKRAGASWADVVDITSFHTDLKTQMPAIVAVKSRYIKAPFPAWTAIQVVRLIPDNGITEIKIIARRPAKR